MAAIDYGVIILKNGERYKRHNLYPEINELGILFYKNSVNSIVQANLNEYYCFTGEKFVEKIIFNNINIKVKTLIRYKVFIAEIFHNKNRYNIIFGYGIDNDLNVWNKIKIHYLGKKGAKKVDNWLRKYGLIN